MRWGSWSDIDWQRLEKVAFWIVAALLAVAAVTWLALALAAPAEAYEIALPQPEAGEVEVLPIPSSPSRLTGEVKVLAVSETPEPATPKPTLAPTPEPVAHGSVQGQIARFWPGDDRKALCVVNKETGGTFNPVIKNPSGKYWGLFQADAAFRAAYGWAGWGVKEQTEMAWRGFQDRGWSPWPTAVGC